MKISKIYFFGYEGLDLKKIQAAIPLKEGAEIDHSHEAMDALKVQISRAVEEIANKKPTDVNMVFFDDSWTLYIGLPGASSHAITFNPPPEGKTELAEALIKAYSDTMDASARALQTGLPEDKRKYDRLLEESKEQSRAITDQLMHVLGESSDRMQRRVAAHCLGLVARSQSEIDALSRAGSDEDSVVRNNAVRALSLIAISDAETARLIPAARFIKLLSSGTWTDRNKGSFVISGLVRNREPGLIGALREQALPSLIEIAGWDMAHAAPALRIIGAIANIPEGKLSKLINDNQRQEIIDALK